MLIGKRYQLVVAASIADLLTVVAVALAHLRMVVAASLAISIEERLLRSQGAGALMASVPDLIANRNSIKILQNKIFAG